MVTSWSHSKLSDFDKCRHMFWLKHDQKIPEPERTLKPGQTEFANDRGTRVHDNCEGYVRGDHDALCPEADKYFGFQLDLMREMYKEGIVSLEGEWGMNKDWQVTAWNGAWEEIPRPAGVKVEHVKTLPERGKERQVICVDKSSFYTWIPTWLRLKLDAMVHVHPTHAIVIDYKTGRKFGNEVKHAEQLQLYQLVAFLRYPELEKVTAELWYLDQNEVTSQTFTRAQGMRFMAGFDKRGTTATTTTSFPPNPNKYSCQWCPYKGTAHCEVGV